MLLLVLLLLPLLLMVLSLLLLLLLLPSEPGAVRFDDGCSSRTADDGACNELRQSSSRP